MRFLPIYLFCVLLSSNVSALDCRKDIFENINFTICKTSLFEDDLRLYLNNRNGVPFGNFNALQKELNDKGKEIFSEIFNLQKKRIYNALLSSSSEEVINFDSVLSKIING